MDNIFELEAKIKKMVDALKGLCNTGGLSNTQGEEIVVETIFTYKNLNDRFMYYLRKFAEEEGYTVDEVFDNKDNSYDIFCDSNPNLIILHKEDTIQYLSTKMGFEGFGDMVDATLKRISNYEHNKKYSLKTTSGEIVNLLDPIMSNFGSETNHDSIAKNIFQILNSAGETYDESIDGQFDFKMAIFEYMIKDYNVASGTYAEYFTPQFLSKSLSKILINMSKVPDDDIIEIYDPAAGSGSLVMHLASQLGKGKLGNRARIYTQDISQKSTKVLRTNFLLNGQVESLNNAVRGDTLLSPSHFNIQGVKESGHKKFKYIVMNPPFKTDFSATRDQIAARPDSDKRFFAGIPAIPKKALNKMAIYLCFIQHGLWCLDDDGKMAVVLPTGFLTAQSGIEKKIREYLIKKNYLAGVISYPSNIFANTGTNVSVIFIDKTRTTPTDEMTDEKKAAVDTSIILIDASKLGEQVKDGNLQKTVLSTEEIELIENTFINKEEKEDFSVLINTEKAKAKNYSFSTGQYFDVKIEYSKLTEKEFKKKIDDMKKKLSNLFNDSKKIEELINKEMEQIGYDNIS